MSIRVKANDPKWAQPTAFGRVTVSWSADLMALGPDGSMDLPPAVERFVAAYPSRYTLCAPTSAPLPPVAEVGAAPVAPPARQPTPSAVVPPASHVEPVPSDTAPPASWAERFDRSVEKISRNRARAAVRLRSVTDVLGIAGVGSSLGEIRDALRVAFIQGSPERQIEISSALEREADA